MRQTTVLIRSTTEENSRVRGYWRWAVSSKSWSRARGVRAFSRVARTMTLTGASRANCSKTSPRSMGVASPESGYLQVERQVSRNIGPPIQGCHAGQGPGAGGGRLTPRLTSQTSQVQQRRQDVGVQSQPGQPFMDLVQEGEALPPEYQPTGLGPRRATQVRQRRRDGRLGLGPVVEASFGREELERRSGLLPGGLG